MSLRGGRSGPVKKSDVIARSAATTNSPGANLDARSAPEGPATGCCRSTNLLNVVVALRGCRVGLRPPRNDIDFFRLLGELRKFQFELDVCKIFLLATEIRNRQRIRGQPCVRKCELD